jgi:hypothetical protein
VRKLACHAGLRIREIIGQGGVPTAVLVGRGFPRSIDPRIRLDRAVPKMAWLQIRPRLTWSRAAAIDPAPSTPG